ncbi:hypothetical protein BLOT_015953 [Blomia tropicalis]|nr:hypothetical protein BLOT_015953 [Blomia tropicalis]
MKNSRVLKSCISRSRRREIPAFFRYIMSKNSNPSGKGSHPGLTGNKGFVKKFGKGSATKCAKSSSSGFKLSKSRTSNGSKSNSSKCSGKRVGFKLFGINVGLKLPAPKSGSSSSKASKSSKCKASGMTKLCSSKSRSKSNRKSQTTTTITKSGRSKSKSTTKSCGKNQSKGSIKSKSRSKNASKEEVKGMSRSVDNDGWEYVYMWNYEDGTTQPANVPEENQNQILTVQPGTAGANAVGSSVIVAPNSAPPQSGIAATPSQIPAGQDQILAREK